MPDQFRGLQNNSCDRYVYIFPFVFKHKFEILSQFTLFGRLVFTLALRPIIYPNADTKFI